jgi:septum formation protein
LVLVSGSPRRRELLEQLGVPFEIVVPGVDESVSRRLDPITYVRIVSVRKLMAFIERNDTESSTRTQQGLVGRHGVPNRIVLPKDDRGPQKWALAADTVVALGRHIMGKPADRAEAEEMLRALSGRSHRVVTGLALHNPNDRSIAVATATTRVQFARLSEDEIQWYLDSGEWRDVAGAYRIQERGSLLVKRINGSYSNVVGLPIETFYDMVQAQGIKMFPFGN